MAYEARSYAEVGELMKAVMDDVLADGWEPDMVVCVERGGRVPADMALARTGASCKTPAKMVRVEASKYDDRGNVVHKLARVYCAGMPPEKISGRVLVVDDVLETGDTMRAVVRGLDKRGASDIRVAAAFKKSSYADADVSGCRVYYGEEVDDETWIIPEWEDEEYQKIAGGSLPSPSK